MAESSTFPPLQILFRLGGNATVSHCTRNEEPSIRERHSPKSLLLPTVIGTVPSQGELSLGLEWEAKDNPERVNFLWFSTKIWLKKKKGRVDGERHVSKKVFLLFFFCWETKSAMFLVVLGFHLEWQCSRMGSSPSLQEANWIGMELT